MEKTLRCISSLLNLDAFNTKRKKLLHQRLQNTSCMRILKLNNQKSRVYTVPLTLLEAAADEPQEK
jgi:hypothetical protein